MFALDCYASESLDPHLSERQSGRRMLAVFAEFERANGS